MTLPRITKVRLGESLLDGKGVPNNRLFLLLSLLTDLDLYSGSGSPEGVVSAKQKSLYMDEAGAGSNILYVKRDAHISGDESQGWIQVGGGAANPFDQSLDTTDSPSFVGVTTNVNLIETQTASNSSAMDFNLPGGYNEYLLVLSNVIPATDGDDLHILTSADGGSTFDTGASDYRYTYSQFLSTGISGGSSTADSKIVMTASVGSGGTSEPGVSAHVRIILPSQSVHTVVNWTGGSVSDLSADRGLIGQGRRRAAAAVDAIRVKYSSGNVESGEFALFGTVKQ